SSSWSSSSSSLVARRVARAGAAAVPEPHGGGGVTSYPPSPPLLPMTPVIAEHKETRSWGAQGHGATGAMVFLAEVRIIAIGTVTGIIAEGGAMAGIVDAAVSFSSRSASAKRRRNIEKVVEARNQSYRKFVAAEEDKKRGAERRKQGALLADALSNKLDEELQQSAITLQGQHAVASEGAGLPAGGAFSPPRLGGGPGPTSTPEAALDTAQKGQTMILKTLFPDMDSKTCAFNEGGEYLESAVKYTDNVRDTIAEFIAERFGAEVPWDKELRRKLLCRALLGIARPGVADFMPADNFHAPGASEVPLGAWLGILAMVVLDLGTDAVDDLFGGPNAAISPWLGPVIPWLSLVVRCVRRSLGKSRADVQQLALVTVPVQTPLGQWTGGAVDVGGAG
ncbi:unnamed protein product, partial [Prorocentrum cordatum]